MFKAPEHAPAPARATRQSDEPSISRAKAPDDLDSAQIARLLGSGTQFWGPPGAATGEIAGRKQTPDDKTRLAVIRLSLLNAQHWLDTVEASTIISSARMIDRHLAEATSALAGAPQGFDTSTLDIQMDETSRALGTFADHVALSEDSVVDDPSVDHVFKKAAGLRMQLGLPEATKVKSHRRADKKDDAYEALALGPVIDLAGIEAEVAYKRLEADGDRGQIVRDATETIGRHVEHAIWLLEAHEGKGETAKFAARIEAASVPMHKIRAWTFGRPSGAELSSTFLAVVRQMNRLRSSVGLGLMRDMPTADISQGEHEEAVQEQAWLTQAKDEYFGTLQTEFIGFKEGADRFFVLASLTPSPAETPFWVELAKGILISTLTNLMGDAGSFIAKELGADTEKALDLAGGSTTDTLQYIEGAAEGAVNKARSQNQEVRDSFLFKEGLVMTQALAMEKARNDVGARIAARDISRAELKELTAAVDGKKAKMSDISYRAAAHGFAKLTAQVTLGGVETNAAGKVVSKMDDHFRHGRSESARLSGRMDRTSGVGQLRVRGTQIQQFEIHGLNPDMAIAVLEHAEHRLEKLDLPLEIHIEMPGDHPDDYALAVDEIGTLRAASKRENSNHGIWTALDGDELEGAAKFWAALRQKKVPKSAAKIEEGG